MGKGVATYKRSIGERELDLIFISERLIKGGGGGINTILRDLSSERSYKVTPQMVYGDIRKVMDDWEKQRRSLIDKRVAFELAQINKLQQTYYDAWERSMQEKVVKTTKKGGQKGKDEKGNPIIITDYVTETIQRKESVGDAKWLRGVEWCIEMRARLIPNSQKEADDADDASAQGMVIRDITFEVYGRKSTAGFAEPIEILPPDGENKA